MGNLTEGNVYDAIGVRHYINCVGQVTLLGASSMSPTVWKAMEEANNPPEPVFLAEGWVEDLGMVIGRPGTHKLEKGGQVYFILKSEELKLNDYLGKRVGVNGEIETKHRGWEPVLVVKEIAVLYEE